MLLKLTIEEGILNSMADDGESIVQIENELKRDGLPTDRNLIKNVLINLIKQNLIVIVYPYNTTIEEFIFCSEETIEDYWFDMTTTGRQVWEKIECPD